MSDLAVSGSKLPQVTEATAAMGAVGTLVDIAGPYWSRRFGGGYYDQSCAGPAAARRALEAAALVVPQMLRPATEREIQQHLAALVGCFPAGKTEHKVFGRLLVLDVCDEQPSIGALTAACRQLRREQTFMPVIAEVLAALKSEKSRLRAAEMALREMPALIEAHEAQIREDRERAERKRLAAANG